MGEGGFIKGARGAPRACCRVYRAHRCRSYCPARSRARGFGRRSVRRRLVRRRLMDVGRSGRESAQDVSGLERDTRLSGSVDPLRPGRETRLARAAGPSGCSRDGLRSQQAVQRGTADPQQLSSTQLVAVHATQHARDMAVDGAVQIWISLGGAVAGWSSLTLFAFAQLLCLRLGSGLDAPSGGDQAQWRGLWTACGVSRSVRPLCEDGDGLACTGAEGPHAGYGCRCGSCSIHPRERRWGGPRAGAGRWTRECRSPAAQQVRSLQQGTLGPERCPGDHLAQLGDIAGPGMGEQEGQHIGSDAGERLAVLRGALRHELLHQHGDIFAAVPQRGQRQLDGSQLLQQVMAEAPVHHQRAKRALG